VHIGDVSLDLVLSAIASCVCKKVVTDTGCGWARAALKLLVEEEMAGLVLELEVPRGVSLDKARASALTCPALGMVLHLLRKIEVRAGG